MAKTTPHTPDEETKIGRANLNRELVASSGVFMSEVAINSKSSKCWRATLLGKRCEPQTSPVRTPPNAVNADLANRSATVQDIHDTYSVSRYWWSHAWTNSWMKTLVKKPGVQ